MQAGYNYEVLLKELNKSQNALNSPGKEIDGKNVSKGITIVKKSTDSAYGGASPDAGWGDRQVTTHELDLRGLDRMASSLAVTNN